MLLSSVTKPVVWLALFFGCSAPVVIGKSVELVLPTTKASPLASNAIRFALSNPLPVKNVEYSRAVPVLLNFATNGLPHSDQKCPTQDLTGTGR